LTPLDQICMNDNELEPEVLVRSIECKKLLLDAGADPTISYFKVGGEEESSAFMDAINFGTTVSNDTWTKMNGQ
jgi:hypothetical protein